MLPYDVLPQKHVKNVFRGIFSNAKLIFVLTFNLIAKAVLKASICTVRLLFGCLLQKIVYDKKYIVFSAERGDLYEKRNY